MRMKPRCAILHCQMQPEMKNPVVHAVQVSTPELTFALSQLFLHGI